MAKKKLPASHKPAPMTVGGEVARTLQDWLDWGGGKAEGKGGPILRGDDPRNEGAVGEVGFAADGTPVELPPKQLGKPADMGSLHVLEGPSLLHPGTSGDFDPRSELSNEQIKQLMDDLFGTSGGIRNKDAMPGEHKGPLIYDPPPDRKGPMINIGGGPLGMPRGPLIFDPPSMPTGPLINTGTAGLPTTSPLLGRSVLPDWMTQPSAAPKVSRKQLLAQMARNQAKANGHHILHGG